MKKLIFLFLFLSIVSVNAQDLIENYRKYILNSPNNVSLFQSNSTNGVWASGMINGDRWGIFEDATSTNEWLSVLPGGNVGIGTTSPGKKLEIKGGDGVGIRLFNEIANTWDILNTQYGKLDFVRGGINTYMRIDQHGNIGIGTTSPKEKFHLEGNLLLDVYNSLGNENGIFFRENFTTSNIYNLSILTYDHSDSGVSPDGLSINAYDGVSFSTGNNIRNERMRINRDGNVGIGTTTTGSHKLAVEGSIGAREIKVEATDWSDFVFENTYTLPTLEEVEQHINEKGHLKDIPSAKDVEENGIYLGEMNAKLLQKIEELTLYAIEQEKKLKVQDQEIIEQRMKNKELEERLSKLEQMMDVR